jgi:branched-chain amino acid transport system substrate-binding protein
MTKRSIVTLLGCLALGLAVAAAPAVAADTVKLGFLYSITGPGSSLGPIQMQTAKLAVKHVNAAGGVTIGGKKMKVEVVERDDETKPDVAIRRTTELVQDQKVNAVIGGTFAHVSLAMNNESKKQGFFLMTTNGVPDEYFTKAVKGPYSLAVLGDNGMVGRGAAAYVTEKMKAKNVVFFMPDYAYGKFAYAGAEAVLKTKKDVKYSVVWSPVGTADMTPFLIKAMDLKPDVLCLGHWGNDAINALKAVGEMGVAKKTKVFFNWIIDVMAVGIPPEALEWVWCQMWWYSDLTGFKDEAVVKAAKEFTEKYKAEYKIQPDPYGMMAYFGVTETLRAMELANSTDPKKMYEALMAKPEFTTAKGPAKWRVDGRPAYKYNSWIVEGKGPKVRKDPKYDYAKVIDVYEGEIFLPKVKEMGW